MGNATPKGLPPTREVLAKCLSPLDAPCPTYGKLSARALKCGVASTVSLVLFEATG